uniref:Uncharacterized protein n=1 Tax=Anguilla anguilla TaxID=7936 RepID=A0A0E9XSZ0_ANGAN
MCHAYFIFFPVTNCCFSYCLIWGRQFGVGRRPSKTIIHVFYNVVWKYPDTCHSERN